MIKKFGVLFILFSSLVFIGCAKKPVVDRVQVSNSPVSTKTHYMNRAVTHPPHKITHNVHWRCVVADRHHTWHASAGALVDAQRKAKRLCEQMSAGRSLCRYKGCVQVES